LSVANDRLYVADTNNHAVRVIDLKTKATSTLRITGLEPPKVTTEVVDSDGGPNATEIKTTVQRVKAGSDGTLVINALMPAGYHLNPAAPQRYRVSVETGGAQIMLLQAHAKGMPPWRDKHLSYTSKDLRLPITIPFKTLAVGAADLSVQITLFYCREDNTGTCLIKTLVWRVPVEVSDGANGPNEIKLQGKLPS
jgi:hypothetical protein